MGERFRGRYGRNLLITSFLVIFLPLLALMLMIDRVSLTLYEQRRASMFAESVARAVGEADEQLSAVTRIPAQLASEEELRDLYDRPFDPFGTLDIRARLYKYRLINPLVADLLLYIPAHAMVYTGTRALPSADDSLIRVTADGGDYEGAMGAARNLYTFSRHRMKAIERAGKEERMLFYTAPVYKRGDQIEVLASVALDQNALARSLVHALTFEGMQPCVMLFSQSGEVLFQSDERVTEEQTARLWRLDGTDGAIELGGERYAAQLRTGRMSGCSYAVLLPSSALVGDSRQGARALGWIVLAVITSAAGTWLFLSVNYAPIRSLYRMALKYAPYPRDANEVVLIRDTVALLEKKIDALTRSASRNQDALVRAFLLDVASGHLVGAGPIRARAAELGLESEAKSYAVAFVASDDIEELERQVLPLNWIDLNLLEDEWRLCAIISDAQLGDEQLRSALEDAANAMRDRGLDTPGIGIGGIRDNLSELPGSYAEARAVAAIQRLTGDTIVAYSDVAALIPERGRARRAPFSYAAFARAVAGRDAAQATHMLRRFETLIANEHLPMPDMRQICFDLHAAAQTALPDEPLCAPDFARQLFRARTREEVVNFLQSLGRSLSDRLGGPRWTEKLDIAAVEALFERNFMREDFSIREIAARSGGSFPHFSQWFRAQKGMLPIDYLTNLRMAEAARLLLESDESVNAIVERVGYHSASSFIRRFRQYAGITPGEYRALRTAPPVRL